jgi:1,4-dihydroxy-2-naphthoyl-CoA hydrolase
VDEADCPGGEGVASTSTVAELEGQSAFLRLLGAHFDEARGDRVTGWLEVGADHHQPWGLVHGGVFTAIIETFATVGAYQAVKDREQLAVGVSNVTDFLRPQREGRLNVVAEPIQQGRTQQLWQVVITRAEDGKAVARGQVRLQNIDASQS